MAMPLSSAQGIKDREGGSAPTEPGVFRDQLNRHGPLADARGGQNPLTGVLALSFKRAQGASSTSQIGRTPQLTPWILIVRDQSPKNVIKTRKTKSGPSTQTPESLIIFSTLIQQTKTH